MSYSKIEIRKNLAEYITTMINSLEIYKESQFKERYSYNRNIDDFIYTAQTIIQTEQSNKITLYVDTDLINKISKYRYLCNLISYDNYKMEYKLLFCKRLTLNSNQYEIIQKFAIEYLDILSKLDSDETLNKTELKLDKNYIDSQLFDYRIA